MGNWIMLRDYKLSRFRMVYNTVGYHSSEFSERVPYNIHEDSIVTAVAESESIARAAIEDRHNHPALKHKDWNLSLVDIEEAPMLLLQIPY